MEVISWIVGLIVIGIGFLVKAAPELIAGYNTMSKEKKSNVDINGLSSYLKKGLIAIGLSIILGYYLFFSIGLYTIANSMVIISVLGGVTLLVVNAKKFDRNTTNKKVKATNILLVATVLFVIGLFYYGSKPMEITVSNESLLIKGMYGFELPMHNIREVKLVEKIPTITLRTNGYSFGSTKKGYFNLEEYGNCRLFLCSNSSPYLLIVEENGKKTIINFDDKKATETTFEKLKTINNK